MESELFGHEKGAFTGALSLNRGFFESADGGVIFLDEIGDLPLELQPKLLRVLQFGTFSRLGGRDEISVDVQVISATSKDLYHEMAAGNFRKDLFHRLAVEIVNIPPLREREDDILLLATYFMRDFSKKMKKPLTGIHLSAQRLLKSYGYEENNVRELRNTIERAVLNAAENRITAKDVVFSDDLLFGSDVRMKNHTGREPGSTDLISMNEESIVGLLGESGEKDMVRKVDKPYYRVLHEMEKKLILLSLRESGWKVKPAAVLLGVNPYNFRKKLKVILSEMLEENEGDIAKVSQRYTIPPRFVRAKLTTGRTANISRSGRSG